MSAVNFNLSPHKSLEIQLNLFDHFSKDTIFEFTLNWHIKCDHAGPRCQIILFRVLYLNIMIYDHRHWNHDTNDWEKYE